MTVKKTTLDEMRGVQVGKNMNTRKGRFELG